MSLEGSLTDIPLGELFQIISMANKTGSIVLHTVGASAEILLSNGKVCAVCRSSSTTTVGEILFQDGLISPQQYQEMMFAHRHHPDDENYQPPLIWERYGVQEDDVENTLRNAIEQIIYPMFEWDGTFDYTVDDNVMENYKLFSCNSTMIVIKNGINPQWIAMEGMRLLDERKRNDPFTAYMNQENKPQAPQMTPAYDDPLADIDTSPAQDIPEEQPEESFADIDTDKLTPPEAIPATPETPPTVETATTGATLEQEEVQAVPTTTAEENSATEETDSKNDKPTTVVADKTHDTVIEEALRAAAEATAVLKSIKTTDIIPPKKTAIPTPEEAKEAAQQAVDQTATQPIDNNDSYSAANKPEPPDSVVAAAPAATKNIEDYALKPLKTALPMPQADTPAALPAPTEYQPLPEHMSQQAVTSAVTNTILIIDDDEVYLKQIASGLASLEAKIVTSQAVKSGLEIFKKLSTEEAKIVVIADLVIARSDSSGILGGLEILQQVKELAQDTVVVMVTDYNNADAKKKALELGVNNFIVKPKRAHIIGDSVSPEMASYINQIQNILSGYCQVADVVKGQESAQEAAGNATAAKYAIVDTEAASSALKDEAEEIVSDKEDTAKDQENEESDQDANETIAENDHRAADASNTDTGIKKPEVAEAETVAAESTATNNTKAADDIPSTSADDSQEAEPKNSDNSGFDLSLALSEELRDMGSGLGSEETPQPDSISREMGALRSMLSELNDPSSNENIALLILRFASDLLPRAAFFLVDNNKVIGLGGYTSFASDGDNNNFIQKVRKLSITVDMESVFKTVINFRIPYRGSLPDTEANNAFARILGSERPKEIFVAPIISGNRVAAVLYGDTISAESHLEDTQGLEIFLLQAGLAMERTLLERKLREASNH